MIFNGFDFTDLLVVEYIDRSLMPSISIEGTNMPGKHGVRFKELVMSPTEITVKCRIIGTSRIETQQRIRTIAGKLYTETPARLELRDEPDKYNMAILSGSSDVEKWFATGYMVLTFECTDIYAYSKAEKTQTLNTSFTNEGTYPSTGIIEVQPNIGDTLVISNGTKSLTLMNTFNGTETIKVFLEKQLITMNNNNAMYLLTLDSDFFDIPTGSAKITATGTGTVTYVERWI